MKKNAKINTVLLLIGFSAGLANGLLGAAGGIVIVMGLRVLYSNKTVTGQRFYTTAIAVMLPLSALSAWQYAKGGHLPQISPFTLILPAILGGAVGALLLRRISARIMNRIFAAVVLISGVILAV